MFPPLSVAKNMHTHLIATFNQSMHNIYLKLFHISALCMVILIDAHSLTSFTEFYCARLAKKVKVRSVFTMAAVLLPCDVEEWWEDKKLFVLLSSARSLQEFDLLIKSHTRENKPQSVISRRLEALSGLNKFLVDFCSAEEQKTFMSVTLPFIAQSASILDERVPDSGIPFLERQECK